MKAFLVGLLFLIVILIMTGVAFLLLPLLLVMTFFLRALVIAALLVFAIWLLGKIVLYVWEALNKKTPRS